MDMEKTSKTSKYGCPPAMDKQRIVVGAKQLRKALQSGMAVAVYLAENADPAITEPIVAMCAERNIQPIWVRSKEELGRRCGIEVGAAAAAVVR